MDNDIALKNFELTNDIKEIDAADKLFQFDEEAQKRVVNQEPWKKDPHYFKTTKISAVALIKMVIHARSGGIYEIMGLMSGKVDGDSIVITDSFALPVQGTETRVNAQNDANEYMIQFIESTRQQGTKDSIIGWYHSHPGYGCWLSGIDVDTQNTNQKYQDPFVAVVIDPNRTISAGKVDIGAFRTYPEGYKPTASSSEYQSIPLNKIEDFGHHANEYYPLDVQIFKSTLDSELLGLLWNKYWVNTLSSSPLISNRAYAVSQLNDLAAKLNKATGSVATRRQNPENLILFAPSSSDGKQHEGGGGKPLGDAMVLSTPGATSKGKAKGKETATAAPSVKVGTKGEDSAIVKAVKDSTRISSEAQHGLISQILKDFIFSNRPGSAVSTAMMDSAIESAMP